MLPDSGKTGFCSPRLTSQHQFLCRWREDEEFSTRSGCSVYLDLPGLWRKQQQRSEAVVSACASVVSGSASVVSLLSQGNHYVSAVLFASSIDIFSHCHSQQHKCDSRMAGLSRRCQRVRRTGGPDHQHEPDRRTRKSSTGGSSLGYYRRLRQSVTPNCHRYTDDHGRKQRPALPSLECTDLHQH